MDKKLNKLVEPIRKLLIKLKSQSAALSFLILTGKKNQGKTTLLRQSYLEHLTIDCHPKIDIYYNAHGVIVELDEYWVNQSQIPLTDLLKKLNRCHRQIKITGIILCMDVNELLLLNSSQCQIQLKSHRQFIDHFSKHLNNRIKISLILTKLDKIAGFSDFFQGEHESDLSKPLGICLDNSTEPMKLIELFSNQFNQIIEQLGQQIIRKIHPIRSSIKRILIREFPLQLANIKPILQGFIKDLSLNICQLQSIFLTSAEQGGTSVDRLNSKIQHEYALELKEELPQSTNYRPYFIEGAILGTQARTKEFSRQISRKNYYIQGVIASAACFSLFWISQQYLHVNKHISLIKQELKRYDQMMTQEPSANSALFHLNNANHTLSEIKSHKWTLPALENLKNTISHQNKEEILSNFLPKLMMDLESNLSKSQILPTESYQTLKVYLMFASESHYQPKEIIKWFSKHWRSPKSSLEYHRDMSLLKELLTHPLPKLKLKDPLVRQTRNYLNALPINYLYYALLKEKFSHKLQNITYDGFHLSNSMVPIYLTKAGYKQIFPRINQMSQELQSENWILERQDLQKLDRLLQDSYAHEYVTWWKKFIQTSMPQNITNFNEAQHLAQTINQMHSLVKFNQFIQEQTKPEAGKSNLDRYFNKKIAKYFTDLNLITPSSLRDIATTMMELEHWLNTLSILNHQKLTSFNLAKSRFNGETIENPLSKLDHYARILPGPIALWSKKIADDIWTLILDQGRQYINQEWQKLVYETYQSKIANRYPFDSNQPQEVSVPDFNQFFSKSGLLSQFKEQFIDPFIDTSKPQWQLKIVNSMMMPLSHELIDQLIHANIIASMFFSADPENSEVNFSLEKLNLDPVVEKISFSLGNITLSDNQSSSSIQHFHWPEANARLALNSIEGNHFELNELGPWALFKILQKVNILEDIQDHHNLQIIFEINGNSGRYLLRTENEINPFIPGILSNFKLPKVIA